MKLASLKEGGRDGTLVVVDKELKKAVRVSDSARTFSSSLIRDSPFLNLLTIARPKLIFR